MIRVTVNVLFQFDSCAEEMIFLVLNICVSQGCGGPAVNQNWTVIDNRVADLKRQMTVNSLGLYQLFTTSVLVKIFFCALQFRR